MPAKSKSEQRLIAAAEHGATFPAAQQIRKTMSLAQMRDYAVGSMKGKPEHVQKRRSGHPHANLGKYLHPKGGK